MNVQLEGGLQRGQEMVSCFRIGLWGGRLGGKEGGDGGGKEGWKEEGRREKGRKMGGRKEREGVYMLYVYMYR